MTSDTSRPTDVKENRTGDKSILAPARKDWDAAEQRERHNIRLAYEDLEFLAGDELSQWPEQQRKERENDGRPTLQINQLPQRVGRNSERSERIAPLSRRWNMRRFAPPFRPTHCYSALHANDRGRQLRRRG